MLAVAQDLHLEMAGTRQKAFDVERAVAERRFGFGLRGVKLVLESGAI